MHLKASHCYTCPHPGEFFICALSFLHMSSSCMLRFCIPHKHEVTYVMQSLVGLNHHNLKLSALQLLSELLLGFGEDFFPLSRLKTAWKKYVTIISHLKNSVTMFYACRIKNAFETLFWVQWNLVLAAYCLTKAKVFIHYFLIQLLWR